MNNQKTQSVNFIRNIIEKDLSLGKHSLVHTRFSPEPNGYLHIGHAKSICLNFGIANDYHGKCNLRFDDTNPLKEDVKYIDSIKHDIRWLGFQWSGNVRYSSDYFDILYSYALELIDKGLAYVDQLSTEEIRKYRGTLTECGKNSPYRNRSIKDNRILFSKMRLGQFTAGNVCLRAKIDMNSPSIIMRDPVLYRIKFAHHHQTGNKWCIYPMYDFAHCISDAIEGITHSLCTLEFQENRQLYNWILDNITISYHPKQYEFSRLNLEYSIISKRKLNLLVESNVVDGWDDPRMPTIAGLRRRGYTASSIRNFCNLIGVTKQDNNIKISTLEACIREELNNNAPRIMAVIDPVKIIIKSLPKNYELSITVPNHPNNPDMGTRQIKFNRELFIDRSDFREVADEKYRRLVLGCEVRLRYSYIIRAEYIEKDCHGQITTIFCSHDPNTFNKNPIDGRKIKGVIHWVSAIHSIKSEFRLYNQLFNINNPESVKDIFSILNSNSLIIKQGFVEINGSKASLGQNFQFERVGYFCADNQNYCSSYPIFNRTLKLKNSWTI